MSEDRIALCITYAKRMLVDNIYSAANVEGLGTTYPNTEAILFNLPVSTTRDEMLFILNMRDAWRLVLDNIGYVNSLMFLRQVNRECGKNDLIYESGSLRTVMVSIGGTEWKPDIPYESDVLDSLRQLDSISDGEAKAIAYFCYIVRAQLFIDGNKRVAQLIANKILIENGIGIFKVPVKMVSEFKIKLVRYYETNKAKELVDFIRKYCITRL